MRREIGREERVELGRVEVAAGGEGGVQRRRGVPLAEDEAVALRVVRPIGVDAEDPEVERSQDVQRRELAADVAQAGLVDHAQVAKARQGRLLTQLGSQVRHRSLVPLRRSSLSVVRLGRPLPWARLHVHSVTHGHYRV